MRLSFLHPSAEGVAEDVLAERLKGVSRAILIVVCGLFPILFVPSVYMPLPYGKAMFMALAVFLAGAIYLFSVLREGTVSVRWPLMIIALWVIAAVTLTAAALSGDRHDGFFGNGLDSYTASFTVLMAMTATVMGVFARRQNAIIRLYTVLMGSALVLSLFHILRLVFGPDTFSFGLWTGATVSPVGSWNGLAIFYGLVVLLSLLALQQLPLTKLATYIAKAVIVLSVFILAAINFSSVWWVLAFVAGSIVAYELTKNLWQKDHQASKGLRETWRSFIAASFVFIVAVVFIAGGAKLGDVISNRLGVPFVEVRPSVTATLDLGQQVYREHPWFGSGPNRFSDVWRLHKNPVINQTIFWNAQFDSGYSYVLTAIIGTGVVGLLAWLFFLLVLVWSGFRFVFRAEIKDRFWYFIGLSSLVASLYFWGMSLIYVPPPSILLLTAVTTGIFAAAYGSVLPMRGFTLSSVLNRNYGFALIALAVVVISASGYGVYMVGRQVWGTYEFSKALASVVPGDDLTAVEPKITAAFDLSSNDVFARQVAIYRGAELQRMIANANSTQPDKEKFQAVASGAIQAAQLAVSLDPTDPYNHQVLGQIYSLLTIAGIEGASDRAKASYEDTSRLDPQSPVPYLLEAQLAAGGGDNNSARAAIEMAIKLKPNYTEALFMLAQLDISEGKTDSALAIVNGLVQLEPQNPARRYQLGVLLASQNHLDEAISAFEQAVALDPQYANARYFLALGYAEKGQPKDAIDQLKIVRDLNPDNTVVDSLISQLEKNGKLDTNLSAEQPVTERDANSGQVTESDLDNGLVTSSTPVPDNAEESPVQ